MSLRKLGYNVIENLAVLLIGLGGLEFSEFVHDPQHVCSRHHLPLSAIIRSHFLQQRENLVIRILGALCLWYLLEECQFPPLCPPAVTSSGLSSDVSDVGLPSEKVVVSGKNGDDGDLLLFRDGPEVDESSLVGMECPVVASYSGELSGTLLESD
ncbi:hypothetical protein Tco_0965800 [Tanacetum coccineum]